jgi:hypothetical protein
MILKEDKEEYKEATSPPVHGCDCCEGGLDRKTSLEITIHHHDAWASEYEFCSWRCVFIYVYEMDFEGVWFIDLPLVSSKKNRDDEDTNINGLKSALRGFKDEV